MMLSRKISIMIPLLIVGGGLTVADYASGQKVIHQFSPGIQDDGKTYLPAGYPNFAPPPAGLKFTDGVFGTLITRLSNGFTQFNDPVHHEYSSMSPFNADNTRVLLLGEFNGFFVADLRGNVIVSADALNLGGLQEPRWSLTDRNIFYYHEDNQLRKYDLATRARTVVRGFPQFTSIDFGGGESDLSEDGDHLMIIGDKRYVGVYTISSNSLGPTLDTLGYAYDYFDLTPNNNVLANWGGEGTGRYQGFELFDQRMNFIRQVAPFSAHADRARDSNGDEVLIVIAAADSEPAPGCAPSGIEKIRLADSRKTCLLPLNWYAETHISANSDGRNPWALVSVTDTTSGTAMPNEALPTDWANLWGPRYNELILVRVDGSEARRIAHHRSRILDDYWFTPRAALSRDGRFAIFDSNFGASPLPAYTDVFLTQLTSQVTTASAASYRSEALAPEAVSAAFGTNLATATVSAAELPLPISLGGTTVIVRDGNGVDRPAPLFFVSPRQINYQLPAGTAHGAAMVTVTAADGHVSHEVIQVNAVAPGLFSADSNGQGLASALVVRLRPDNSLSYEPVIQFDPAQNKFIGVPIDLGPPGDQVFLVLFGTGLRFRSSLAAVSASVGGVPAEVTYAGIQGGFVGVDQVNLRISRELIGQGDSDIALTVDGQAANVVKVVIR
jgi:uncharacterized protein (TIGR03437 family)